MALRVDLRAMTRCLVAGIIWLVPHVAGADITFDAEPLCVPSLGDLGLTLLCGILILTGARLHPRRPRANP